MRLVILALGIMATISSEAHTAEPDHWQKMYLSCLSADVVVNAHRSCIPPGDLFLAAESECKGSLRLADQEIEMRYALDSAKRLARMEAWRSEMEEYRKRVIAMAVEVQINKRHCP
ncbi:MULTISPECIES: hypothetical protein [unclassified Rhizobium]|uniref:hypothetical protein n=1 Tax=unclassified Rhizobium TaxID=2613769 RepID=UPI0021F72437|nr:MULTISPECIES: hypothetical protein [unclassified Rhizobium]MCV9943936.1 hypothetical protein [Rhizobium sp. BT-175]MCW0017499.1 hypothetical protein [Rhizobium sp. BT-226]